jgi:C-terminal processing protease CtpA/Prc
LRNAAVWPLLCLGLASCGGGGGDDAPAGGGGGGSPTTWVQGSFLPASGYAGRCVNPRSTPSPMTGLLDTQGTVVDQNNWLRSWSNDLYLWYNEIADRDPSLYTTAAYFPLLKTTATTASGRDKDRFHFTYSTTEWLSLSQSGVEAGYGAQVSVVSSLPPRRVVVAYIEPGSPAANASPPIQRGEEIVTVDGVDVVNDGTQAGVNLINAAIFPSAVGETHTFTLRNPNTATQRTLTLQSAAVTKTPVQAVSTLATASGTVGYFLFNDHIATAEQQLIAAFNTLRNANVSDLVIDVRYNGGGFLSIASEVAYMVAGPARTSGQTFELLRFNDKHQSIDPVTGVALTPVPFHSTTRGFSTTAGQPLPTLNLSRVFVLTGGTTCSASESIMNALRGVNVEVIQIGSTTCGKPYGFYPTDNCGTTYFSVQFKGVNAAGFGDYTDGFSPNNTASLGGTRIPGCSVADDFTQPLGNPAEARLAAALSYRLSLSCPAPSGSKPSLSDPSKPFGVDGGDGDGVAPKTPWLENRILDGL